MSQTYTEKRIVFGEAPQHKPAVGEMWVLVGPDDSVEAVDFLCPCGCGNSCYTPVTDADKGEPKTVRHWLFSSKDGKVTLSPSIRYTSGCKAHFNITDGKAVIHGDSGK